MKHLYIIQLPGIFLVAVIGRQRQHSGHFRWFDVVAGSRPRCTWKEKTAALDMEEEIGLMLLLLLKVRGLRCELKPWWEEELLAKLCSRIVGTSRLLLLIVELLDLYPLTLGRKLVLDK